ncbi:MAG: HEAT repeat domain-containing protein [Myxococcota bacterium]
MNLATKTRVMLAAATLCAAGGLCWLAMPSAPATASAPAEAVVRYDLTVGQQFRYALAFDSDQAVQLPELTTAGLPGLDTHMSIRATVDVTVEEETRDGWILSWAMENVQDVELSLGALGDIDADEARAAFDGQRVSFALHRDGSVGDVFYAKDTPLPFRKLAKVVLAETQVRAVRGSDAAFTQDGALGRAAMTATLATGRDGAIELQTDRTRYDSLRSLSQHDASTMAQSIDHEGRVTFDGYVVTVAQSETTQVDDAGTTVLSAEHALSWTRTGTSFVKVAQGDAKRPPMRVGLDERASDPDLEQGLREAAAGDLEFDELADHIARFDAELGRPEDHSKMVAQAIAFLRLHPERCADLELLFASGLTPSGRALTLDLLALTGHDAAQQSLVRALSTDIARTDDEVYAAWVQRLSRIQAPSAATARFAHQELRRAQRPHERIAAAYSAGAIVRKLEDPHAKETVYGTMVDMLERADDPKRRAELLHALANAGQPGNSALARRHAHDASPAVRRAAASALLHVQGPEAAETLASLAHDESPAVQRAALRMLAGRPLEAEREGAVLAQLEGGVHPSALTDAYRLLAQTPASAARGDAALALAAQTVGDPTLRAKLEALAGTG